MHKKSLRSTICDGILRTNNTKKAPVKLVVGVVIQFWDDIERRPGRKWLHFVTTLVSQ